MPDQNPVNESPPQGRLGPLMVGVILGAIAGCMASLLVWAQFYEEYGGAATASDWVIALVPAGIALVGCAYPKGRWWCVGALVGYLPPLGLLANWLY